MALGLPIVACAVGEFVAYLEDGHAGLLVEPGNRLAFAVAIVALLRDPDRAFELGRQAERRIWDKYDWTRQVERVEDAYRTALGGTL